MEKQRIRLLNMKYEEEIFITRINYNIYSIPLFSMNKINEEFKINNIRSSNLNKTGIIECEVVKIEEKKMKVMNALFECKSCSKKYDIKQNSLELEKPMVCMECGSRNFKLIKDQSTYIDSQMTLVKDVTPFTDKFGRKRKAKSPCVLTREKTTE